MKTNLVKKTMEGTKKGANDQKVDIKQKIEYGEKNRAQNPFIDFPTQ